MNPRIEILPEKKLVGKRLQMSVAHNRTAALWRNFMPARTQIQNAVNSDLYNVKIYPSSYFTHFDMHTEFEKWAAMEVMDFDNVPTGMETLLLPEGLYAVFPYRGPASAGESTFRFIFGTWLPQSEYEVADRPHFDLLGKKYKHEAPDSEEELWIPIRAKEDL